MHQVQHLSYFKCIDKRQRRVAQDA